MSITFTFSVEGGGAMFIVKQFYLFFLSTIVFFSFVCVLDLKGLEFVAASDFHVGRSDKYLNARKHEVRRLLLKYLDTNKTDLVLMVGDLTDHGRFDDCDSVESEWEKFLFDWFYPISEKIGVQNICLCPGNHDTGYIYGKKFFKNESVFDALKNYGLENYSFLKENILFVCCGIYPDLNTRNYLRLLLRCVHKSIPIVMFFHYTISKPCHGFNDDEKNEFYEVIKNRNVIGIINGHKHGTFEDDWNGIPVFGVGGYGFTTFSVSKKNTLKVKSTFADKKRFQRMYSI